MDIPHPLGIFGRVGEGVTTSNSHTTKEVRPSPPPIPLRVEGGGLGALPSSRGAPPPERWLVGFRFMGRGAGVVEVEFRHPPRRGYRAVVGPMSWPGRRR